MLDAVEAGASDGGGSGGGGGGGVAAPTTTISTISLKSGDTRLVIALLQSREYLQLKVLEATPDLTQLGASLGDAQRLQRAHDDVLQQLQSKQSPVEELLRQADELIATQKPRAEVYAAMAESLGLAWQDVNAHLEQRKHMLDLNVAYQSRAEDCLERMRLLQQACAPSTLPADTARVKQLLTELHELKRAMLEALMVTLQEGKVLLETLKVIAAQGTLDSRPDRVRTQASFAVSQVEMWLEHLHDKRRSCDVMWICRKAQLEQCLALALLAGDLRELEEHLRMRRDTLLNSADQLGNSSSSGELLLQEHRRLRPEAKEMQDRGLKITKATEQIVASTRHTTESREATAEAQEATARAYDVLQECAEYTEAVDQRDALLTRAIAFFQMAHNALTKLDQLEVQLSTTELSYAPAQLAQLHAQAARVLHEITDQPIQEGYALLESVGRGAAGAEGVKRTVEELENIKITLESMCTAHKEENLRVTQALTSFLENQNELFSWLVSVAEAFLQGHQDMGSVLAMAEDFHDVHLQLLAEVQQKGAEINRLLLTLPPILERLNDDQRTDVDEKVDNLHSHWLNLKCVVEARIDLATDYVKFHRWAVKLANAFDEVEELFRTVDKIDEDTISRVEQKWLQIQQLYLQLDNLGKSFIEQSVQVTDPHLDVKRACLCVETLLEHFGGRQLIVETSFHSWQTSVTHEREYHVLWQRNVTESSRTVDWVSRLDDQLYPILAEDPTAAARVVSRQLEDKLHVALPEVKRALGEIELRLRTTETLALRAESLGQNEAVTKSLTELHSKLQVIFTDYQILLQMLIGFFKNLADLDKTIELLESQYRLTSLPHSVADIELLLKEHEASRQAIQELFKFTGNECQQIVERIGAQEPPNCAPHDIERLEHTLAYKRMAWEAAWTDRKRQLEQHCQLCHFDSDLHQINSTLGDLGSQLDNLRGQYGESLATAKATSTAFLNFEKTIELLETRIQRFVSTSETMVDADHVSAPHVERELRQLQTRWAALRRQVVEGRRLINISLQYFTLIEEAEEWFRSGSKLLVTIARKTAAVKRPEEAAQLLSDIEMFLKPGETLQDERIKKISHLAVELYGAERSRQISVVLNENREMMESFSVISEELTILSRNLVITERQRLEQKREQDEVDANLAEARAEAAAAKAAAAESEKARLSAESAAQALREAASTPVHRTVDVGVDTMPPPSPEPQVELPPPPPPPVVDVAPPPVAPMFIIPLQDSDIQEGDRFTFECSVTGVPTPDIIWYKDGMSIQNNPDYLTVFHDGRCSLSIEETFTEDSARFSCKAGNIAGIAETSATLSVREAEPDEILSPPVFTRHLHPATAKEGAAFQLVTLVQGNPLPTVTWYKNDECLDSSPDYAITYNNGEGVLRFEVVIPGDEAEYSCKAVNQVGTAATSANLRVEPRVSTVAPSFSAPLSNVMARAGQKIRLECDVTGVPTPQLVWSHNGKPIKGIRDVKTQYDNDKASLVVTEAFPNDAGVYAVTARNVAGEATSTCNVMVKGRLPTETSDSELASDMEPVKPAIQLQLKNGSVFEGARVQLDCVIVGQPEPEVIWYHDGKPVKESPEFKLLFQGDRCSLVIQEVFLEDAGEYKVTAINSGGEASSTCHLTVTSVTSNEQPVTRHVVTPPTEPPVLGTPPKFTKLLTDILAADGDKVVFECCVEGDPSPNIRWYLNNMEIQPKERMEFGEDAEGNISLTILQVAPDNKGVYTVKASNAYGDAKCFAQLIVKTSTSPDNIKKQAEDVTVLPSFRELFADRNVYENEATKFECIVVGKPTPKVRWCFNDVPVSGNGFLVSTSGERQVLAIPKVTPDHVGKIACTAENEAGRASCVATLKIMTDAVSGAPDVATPMETSSITEQIGSSSFTMKRSVFVQSSSSHVTSSSTSLGGATVHAVTTHDEHALRQEGEKPPVEVSSHQVHEFHQLGKDMPHVREEKVINITNGDASHVMAVSSPKAVRKSVAPRFMTPLNGKIVDQGVDVVFEGIIDGFPTPDVSWTKNGVDLKPDGESVTIVWELNKARLELKQVGVKEAGRYTCKAVNQVGSASSTADLVVKKTVFPPVFGRRLQAQMAKVGERVNMEVEVTGTPDPTVTWYKDGQQILGAIPGSKFRTTFQGNCYTLIIEKASVDYSGKYMVRAVNAGGEAQSIADFVVYEPQPDTSHQVIQHLVFEDVVHHTSQPYGQPSGPKAKEEDQPIIPNTLSFAPLSLRCSSPFTTESLRIIESTKKESQLIMRHSHVEPGPELEKPPPPVEPHHVDQPTQQVTPPPVQTWHPTPRQENIIREIPIQVEETKQPEVVKKVLEEEVDVPKPENAGVESSSISKQTAFDFFINKMHENDEVVERKPVDFVSRVATSDVESIVHRREPSLLDNIDFTSTRPQYGSPVYALQPAQISSVNFQPEQPSSLVDSMVQSVHSTSSSMEEFFLQPEPPPEMGFSPKPEFPASYREDVTSRVKRLEESSRVLSPVDIPMGAVRIFPIKLEPLKQEPKPVVPAQKTRPPVYEKKESVEEEICVKEEASQKRTYLTGSTDLTIPTDKVSPKPWEVSQPSTLPWVLPPSPVTQTLPIIRPQAEIQPRPSSPRPSAEAVSMEKLWSPHRVPEPPRPKTPVPTDSLWSSTHTSTEQYESLTSSSYTEDIHRAASPRPSAEGVLMEKLWTPHKPTEIEPIIIRPMNIGQSSDKPSEEGLKMDKIWAHKHKDSGLKKTWPPQEGAETRPILPWSSTKEPEKLWAQPQVNSTLTREQVIERVDIKRETVSEIVKEPIVRPEPHQQVPFKATQEPPPRPASMQHGAQEPPPRPAPMQHVAQEPPPRPAPMQHVAQEPPPRPAPMQHVAQEPPPRPAPMQHVAFNPSQETTARSIPVQRAAEDTHVPVQYVAPKPVEEPKPKPVPMAHVPYKPQQDIFQEFRQDFKESIMKETSQMPPTQHYVSESRVSHKSSIPSTPEHFSTATTTTEFTEMKSSHFEKTEFQSVSSNMDTSADEDRNWKPSEAKKNWPPNQKDEFVLKAPPTVKDVLPTRESPSRRQSIPEPVLDDIVLEPGSPPEFGIARPSLERRLSYKEVSEQELEKDMNKVPTRVPFGSVRIFPPGPKERSQAPPLPPKDKPIIPPPVPAKTPVVELKTIPKKEIKPVETKFERFPDLDPFPYRPDPSKSKSSLGPPPPKPSKFQKGEFGASDYESDVDSAVIQPIWRPYESDTEEFGYRSVKPPSHTPHAQRPQSTEPEPLAPSRFDTPPQFEGPPRPSIKKIEVKKDTKLDTSKASSKMEVKMEKVKKHHHQHVYHQEEKRKTSPPDLKPGSPPEFIQPVAAAKQEPKKNDVPVKLVSKTQESGYMADTDEPRLTMQKSSKHEETSVQTTIQHFTKITENYSQEKSSSHLVQQKVGTPLKPHGQIQTQPRLAPAPSKVLVPSPIPPKDERPSSLEPFPYSADQTHTVTKRPLGPPPPSPSKFLKGDFRESDYESDYDGRIPPRWRPDHSDTDGPMFKPVHPVLTPVIRGTRGGERTPTPPSEFDEPPQFGGPPRPKFTPIEKQPVVKREVIKPVSKPQQVFKPKPVTAKNLPPMEVVIATPAVKDVLKLKPGSPPELAFAPRKGPQKSSPYNNAVQTETSNVVNFQESTEHSHRVVSVQQTTRVIKFGDKENRQGPKLEPFPYKPEPVSPKRSSGPPPTMPKKFIPGEFRESDYESDVEGVHFKPRWTPDETDKDDLRYRKVQPPTRPASVPARSMAQVTSPMEFDSVTMSTQDHQVTSRVEFEAEQKRLRRVDEMRKRFGENNVSTAPSMEVALKPGSPPELAYASGRIPAAASYAATQHMNQMTSTFKNKAKQFVDDIVRDVETSRKPEKPILKASAPPQAGGDEPQAYREESRLAEYGTKHIDPDTGLIYFKYDFGYEFGIVLPGEGKKQDGDVTNKKRPRLEDSKREGDIDFPVIHERTQQQHQQQQQNNNVGDSSKQVPQFRPKKFTHFKSVKWEAASESEMSENEDPAKKQYSLPQLAAAKEPFILIPGSAMSPASMSPSLSPYCSSVGQSTTGGSPWAGLSPVKSGVPGGKGRGSTPSPPSTPSTPRSNPGLVTSGTQPSQPRKPPTFITPLRDIAVVSGQSARFECIVQAEPPPNILWSNNGRILENSQAYNIEFRNGVCRLTIPQAYSDYAGSYTCTATNMLGTGDTTATLQVPGERRFRK